MKAVEKRTAAGEDAIRGVIERLHAALRAKDAAGAVADYDPHNVMFVLAPPLEFTENHRPGTPGRCGGTCRSGAGGSLKDGFMSASTAAA